MSGGGMKRTLLLLARALTRRCPACGSPGIFKSWFALKTECPGCGLVFDREEGYFLGAMMVNLAASELIFALALVALVLATWPTPPWKVIWIGAVVGMAVVPLIFYPFSKTVWIAFDLSFRPAVKRDFARHQRPGEPDGRP
jgi:uncharacterized protein (DUF983 family)